MDKIIFFDGKCRFCIQLVKFIIRIDQSKLFRFVPIQSKQARKLLKEKGVNFVGLNTLYFIDDNNVYQRSRAILRIFLYMQYPYKILYTLRIIPVSLSDRFYKWFATNRYKWFGKNEHDFIFSDSDKDRFIV